MRISDWSSDVCSSDLCGRRRQHRHLGRDRGFARGDLVAERAQHLGLGADETNADFGAGFGESGVFGQETVTRMDRIDASFDCNTDDVRDVEVGGDRILYWADPLYFVRPDPRSERGRGGRERV